MHAMAVPLQGRQHPVSVYYTAAPEESYLDAALAAVMQVPRCGQSIHVRRCVRGATRSRPKACCAGAR